MSGSTSSIIVVMVAVCMVAVTVPAVIVANEDTESTYPIDFDISEIRDKVSGKEAELIKAVAGAAVFEFNGNHFGTNEFDKRKNDTVSQLTNHIINNFENVLKTKNLKCVKADGTEISKTEEDMKLSELNQFKIVCG